MSDVLVEIVAAKKKRLEALKKEKPVFSVEKEARSRAAAPSFLKSISVHGEVSVIAEMKRRSPSAGDLTGGAYDPSALGTEYEKAGARALSVLTEEDYFGGTSSDIASARKSAKIPVLRKDFIVDSYQVFETKAIGASAILLIAACLDSQNLKSLYALSIEVGLDVLLEVHSEEELEEALKLSPECIGINNRNLKTLKTDVQTTFDLLRRIPENITVISESGISKPETIQKLKGAGVRGALIGESILRSADRGAKLGELVAAGRR